MNGVMSAEGHLTNPALFAGIDPPVWKMSLEYLDLVDIYPCPLSYVRGHLFKMLHHLLRIKDNFDLREVMATSTSLAEFRDAVKKLQERYQDYFDGKKAFQLPEELSQFKLIHPPWICQPYVRPPPEVYVKKMEECAVVEGLKRQLSESKPAPGLSKKKLKKLERHPNKKFLPPCSGNNKICVGCKINPGSLKCEYELCKTCCKDKCYKEELDCSGHKILVKTNRERARSFQNGKAQLQLQAEVQEA